MTARIRREAGRTGAVAVQAAGALAMLALLALAAALPAAGQPAPPAAGTSVPLDRPLDRGAYLQRMDVELDTWRMKLHGMGEKAEATGQQASTAAETDLRAAWDRTEADARTLRTATTAEWGEAKASFERASGDLSRAWDKTRL